MFRVACLHVNPLCTEVLWQPLSNSAAIRSSWIHGHRRAAQAEWHECLKKVECGVERLFGVGWDFARFVASGGFHGRER